MTKEQTIINTVKSIKLLLATEADLHLSNELTDAIKEQIERCYEIGHVEGKIEAGLSYRNFNP